MSFRILHPSLFILGVQKGGISTLHKYLSESNEIYFPQKKEIHYFDRHFKKGFDWYLNHFKIEDNNKIMLSGEATPYYFFQPYLPRKFSKIFPDAKFILVFRNPIDRAFSHYQMSVRRNLEDRTFENAIKNERWVIWKEKMKMLFNRKHNVKHKEKSYISRGFYYKQLKRWLKFYSLNNFLFIKSEDLFNNPKNELTKVCSFLNINCIDLGNVEKVNKGGYKDSMKKETQKKLMNIFNSDIKKLEKVTKQEFHWF